jgi:hypothetical protein
MDGNAIRGRAAALGFELTMVTVDGLRMWTWRRGRRVTWPRFPSEATALSWIDHELRTAGLGEDHWYL